MCQKPCRLVVVNSRYSLSLKTAVDNLELDGLSLDINIDKTARPPSSVEEFMPNTGAGKALKLIKTTMKKVDHVLCNGEVYGKPAESMSHLFYFLFFLRYCR